ncbi:MAG: effector-associated constant component EACC1 [Pseudonocardiaceae bacterium]
MTEWLARLGLRIETDPEADAEELAKLAVDLREQLLELDIERADPAIAGQAPPGTRAGEIFVAGALTVMLAHSSGLLTALVETVQSWISLSGGRSVKLQIDGDELEVTGITRADQRELIQAWVDRHSDG